MNDSSDEKLKVAINNLRSMNSVLLHEEGRNRLHQLGFVSGMAMVVVHTSVTMDDILNRVAKLRDMQEAAGGVFVAVVDDEAFVYGMVVPLSAVEDR